MKRAAKFLIVLFILVAVIAGAAAGFFMHSQREAQARYAEMRARQSAVAQILETSTVYTPWLLPAIEVPDSVPSAPATITFTFMGEEHSIQAEASSRIYYGAKIADRNDLWDSLWRENQWGLMNDVDRAYHNALTFEPQMEHAIESVLVQLREIRDTRDLSNDEYIELIVKYVQSIPYCEVHGTLDLDERPVGCPRTPIQVLVDGTGDCDETSMLLAALLHREGFPVSLLLFAPEQHIALGLRVEGEGFEGTGYAYVETTSFSYISEVPESLGDEGEEVVLESDPIVLPMGDEIEEPMPFYSAEALAQVARIIDVRDRAEAAANRRFNFISRTPMSRAEFNRQVALYEACFVPLNRFLDVIPCPNGEINTDFMDRAEAIRWIDRNAWWE